MKKSIALLVCGFLLLGADPSFARAKRSVNSGTSNWWVGAASDLVVAPTGLPALSALIKVGDKTAIQTYLQIANSSPFNFSVAGNVKFTVAGDLNQGFHVGGGMAVGTVGAAETAFFNVNFLAGVHFHIAERVYVGADSGLLLRIAPSPVTISMAGNSAILGLSLLYRL